MCSLMDIECFPKQTVSEREEILIWSTCKYYENNVAKKFFVTIREGKIEN